MKDLHSVWKHRWITPKAKAAKSSIQGWGVVAIKQIHKGETVGVLGGIIVPKSDISSYRHGRRMGHRGIQIDDDFFICPSTIKEMRLSGIFNHSCDPNIAYSNSITFVAIRDIESGEELTFDYATSESFFKPFKCNCGSKACRIVIKPDDWKNPKIQKKLGRYFSPYLKEKVATKYLK